MQRGFCYSFSQCQYLLTPKNSRFISQLRISKRIIKAKKVITAAAAARPTDCIMFSLSQMLITAKVINMNSDKTKELIMIAFMVSEKLSQQIRFDLK